MEQENELLKLRNKILQGYKDELMKLHDKGVIHVWSHGYNNSIYSVDHFWDEERLRPDENKGMMLE